MQALQLCLQTHAGWGRNKVKNTVYFANNCSKTINSSKFFLVIFKITWLNTVFLNLQISLHLLMHDFIFGK
jgi:hypothetical protein